MFVAGDRDFDLSCDGLCDVAFQSERITHFAIVGFGPKVLIRRRANQLSVDADVAALADYRPFNESIHAERFGDFGHRQFCILEGHHRRAGNYAEIVNAREAPDKSLGHAIRQIVLTWVTRKVFQRQHREGLDLGAYSSARANADYGVNE